MNINIKEVLHAYQNKIQRYVCNGSETNRCCICGREATKRFYTTTDYIADPDCVSEEEFRAFAEELGSGFGDVVIGSECIQHITK